MKINEEQTILFDNPQENTGPVTCLGLTFTNDEERREYFREELRKKLSQLTGMEGYPVGNDESIIALSDPPYYTVCPNPWITELLNEWEKTKSESDANVQLINEPYIADVSEGKNDPIYNVHTYHTKVPHKAIMRYILHYTKPNDIVFDGFAGTGMTGVAAYMCGNKNEIESLGLGIEDDGAIYSYKKDENNKVEKELVSKVGRRRAVLNDLSTVASFISYNYNTPLSKHDYLSVINQVSHDVKEQYELLYSTIATDDLEVKERLVAEINKLQSKQELLQVMEANKEHMGYINYVVWSDVFICPECSSEINYYENAVDYDNHNVKKDFDCFHCGAKLQKKSLDRVWITKYDAELNETVKQAKQVPVKINYTFKSRRYDKSPDAFDMAFNQAVDELFSLDGVPTDALPHGYNTKQPIESHGLTHVHHFYTKRNLIVINELMKRLETKYKWSVTSFISRNATKMNRFVINRHNPKGRINGPLTGTLYIPSLVVEQNILDLFKDKTINTEWEVSGNVVQTISTTNLNLPDESIDYIFIDPPFGANIMYSEVNFIWESWLKVRTNNKDEAIQNNVQKKELSDYKTLMQEAFKECFRILKSGKWMTVEFSNTQASVWNAIQSAIQEAGFVIANVSFLDKKHGGIKAMTNTTSVKQDLVISAYKPAEELVNPSGADDVLVWDFITSHLQYLPTFIGRLGEGQYISERDPRILYDRMLAYFLKFGKSIPYSSGEFQERLTKMYYIQDGMVFLKDQVLEYERKKMLVKDFAQMSLFVTDENSAIQWLKQQLMKKPQSRQELHPAFMKEIQHIAKHEILPELDDLLEQNFLVYDGKDAVPDQIMSYLNKSFNREVRGLGKDHQDVKERGKNRWYVPDPNKQADLEKLREKALLREFESYKEEISGNKKRLKQFRTEAIRTGFKKAWSDKDFETIVKVGERLPEKVLQEDEKLLMYFDNAQIYLGM